MLKKVTWGLVGVIGLGTLAYFYESWNKRSKKKYIELNTKLKQIIKGKKDDGKIEGQDLPLIVSIVQEESEKEFNIKYRALSIKRRKTLKERDFEEYLELLSESLERQEEVHDDFLNYVLRKLGKTMEEFEQELMIANQMALRSMHLNSKMKMQDKAAAIPHELTKSRAKNIFIAIIQMQNDPQWAEVFRKIEGETESETNQMALVRKGQMIQILKRDILKNDYKCTMEQLENAIVQYDLMNDPMIKRLAAQMNMLRRMQGVA